MYAGIGRWSSASGSRRSQKVVMYLLETCPQEQIAVCVIEFSTDISQF